MKRETRNRLKALLRSVFELTQRWGINILPHHFYSQIPDIASLRRDAYWRDPSSMRGVSGCEIADQLEFTVTCCPPELTQALPHMRIHETAVLENGEDGGYGPIEAEFLYCFIRSKTPRRVVQIGCGVSTSIILRAASDAGYQPEVICVEPYPMPFLERSAQQGQIRLVKEGAQKVSLDLLTNLTADDFLFVDSTHTVKPGSEVNRIILEVMPKLGPGVWIHFHDIYFPYDYTRGLLDDELFFWSESTLLHAFLINNQHCRMRASMSMLHYAASTELKKLFFNYEPQGSMSGLRGKGGRHFPSAAYLQTF